MSTLRWLLLLLFLLSSMLLGLGAEPIGPLTWRLLLRVIFLVGRLVFLARLVVVVVVVDAGYVHTAVAGRGIDAVVGGAKKHFLGF